MRVGVGGQELWWGLGKEKRCSPGLSHTPLRDSFLDPTHFLFTTDFPRRTLITEGLRVSQMRLLLPHSTMVAAVSSTPTSGMGGSHYLFLFIIKRGFEKSQHNRFQCLSLGLCFFSSFFKAQAKGS